MSEKPPKIIPDIIQEDREKSKKECKHPNRSRLFEKHITTNIQSKRRRQKIQTKYLRQEPTIIPIPRQILELSQLWLGSI